MHGQQNVKKKMIPFHIDGFSSIVITVQMDISACCSGVWYWTVFVLELGLTLSVFPFLYWSLSASAVNYVSKQTLRPIYGTEYLKLQALR